MNSNPTITDMEKLLLPGQRRPVDIALEAARPLPASISEDCAACWQYLPGPARTRKASETDRVLRLLDEIGKDGAR